MSISNEQLAIEIKAGNSDLLITLWEQIKPFICKQARRWISSFNGLHGIEHDDLINAGYFAMLQSIENFDGKRHEVSFIGLLSFYLKKQFSSVYGMQSAAGKNDAIHISVSLDTPVVDDDDTPLSELIPDKNSHMPFEQIVQRDYNTYLHGKLNTILDTLPAKYKEIIMLRYYENQDIPTVAATIGMTEKEARAAENKAMRLIRTPSNIAMLSDIRA
mgnify:CR=1 FL=1